MARSGAQLVSVVVPAWNSAASLAETLRSIAAQTHSNIEILIVDDGSTDDTAEIAAAFCALEPRASLIRQSNGGVGSARNRAIEEARGEWVAPIDADDLWHPTKIEKQVAAALAAPAPVGFVYCWYHYIDQASRVIGSRASWVTEGNVLRQLAYENLVGNGSGALFSRAAVLAAGGFSTSLREGCEDLLLQLIIAESWPVACVPEFLVGYRIHPGTMSRKPELMEAAWKGMFFSLRERGIAIPRPIVRQALAAQYLGFAELRFREGRSAQGLRLLAEALRSDPVRSGLQLGYRASRLAARLVRGRRPRASASFEKAGTTRAYELDPDSLERLSRLLRSLDERRLAKLRVADQVSRPSRAPPSN